MKPRLRLPMNHDRNSTAFKSHPVMHAKHADSVWKRVRPRRVLLFLSAALVVWLLIPFPFGRNPGAYWRQLREQTHDEINQLERAVYAFKLVYNYAPPDAIILKEHLSEVHPFDRSQLRMIWPEFDFDLSQDFNHDGDLDDSFELNGSECLVFFLGGIPDEFDHLMGFSNNHQHPFNVHSLSRQSYFEFDPDRLIDTDGDGFFEFRDPYKQLPYFYWTDEDCSRRVLPLQSTGTAEWKPYRRDGKPYSIQIVSAGRDALLGVGGEIGSLDIHDRDADLDNRVNFSDSYFRH